MTAERNILLETLYRLARAFKSNLNNYPRQPRPAQFIGGGAKEARASRPIPGGDPSFPVRVQDT